MVHLANNYDDGGQFCLIIIIQVVIRVFPLPLPVNDCRKAFFSFESRPPIAIIYMSIRRLDGWNAEEEKAKFVAPLAWPAINNF